ncbi:MAG: helix-turn-helix domain-containing protein [Halofilum sp. (in: g-proteobacteria)]
MVADHIREIERRAEAAGVPMAQVLLVAGINRSTWWRWGRWAQGDPRGQCPRLDALERVYDALNHHESRAAEGD